MYKQLFVALALLTASNSLKAQCLGSCCSAGCNTDITSQSSSDKKGDWQISTAYSIMEYHPFTDDRLEQWSDSLNATFTVASQQNVKVSLQYNLTDRWKLSATLPYDFSFDNREGHTHQGDYKEIHNYGNVKGTGDATFLIAYKWLTNKSRWQFYTGIGVKAPTGETMVLSSKNIGLPQHLEPGTGSWDPVATVSLKKQWKQWMFAGDGYAKIATTANDHNMGDYVSITATAISQILSEQDNCFSSLKFFGAVQADYNSKMIMPQNHIHTGSDPVINEPIAAFDNSGFTRIFISGGTLVSFGKHLTIPFSFSVPLLQHLNGYQVKTEWKSTLGLTINI